MGYFANGTEGDLYEAEYCSSCVHDEGPCSVMYLHLLYNYDECNNKGSFLHVLIPIDDKGSNLQCTMFKKEVSQ